MLTVLAACSNSPSSQSRQDPNASFSEYRTFAFDDRMREDAEDPTLGSWLMNAARKEMEARGYRYDGTDPDLRLNLHLHTEEQVQVRKVPKRAMGPAYDAQFDDYRENYGTWGAYNTDVSEYTEGTLHLDMVDAHRKQLVYEGALVGRLSGEDKQQFQSTVRTAVTELFDAYPYRAPVAVPSTN